jgi:hypothetical protein
MRHTLKLLFLIAAAWADATSAAEQIVRPSGPTQPARTEYFSSEVAGVVLDRAAPTVVFALTLAAQKEMPLNSAIRVEFENPADQNAPFIVTAKIDEKNQLMARSPRIEGITNKRAYLTRTKLLDEDQNVLSTHDQWIWFDFPKAFRSSYATKVID